jgi:hypothetical protein
MNGGTVYQRAAAPANLDLLDGISRDVDEPNYSSPVACSSRKWLFLSGRMPCCRPICCRLLARLAWSLVVWTVFVYLVLSSSLETALQQETQLRTCLREQVCRELSNDEADTDGSTAHQKRLIVDGVSERQLPDVVIDTKEFRVPTNGVYVVYSRLVFRAPAANDNQVLVFEHEVLRNEGDGSRDQPAILRDAQLRNCSLMHSTSGDAVPCHSSQLVAAVLLRAGNVLRISVDPASLLVANHTAFTVSRLN